VKVQLGYTGVLEATRIRQEGYSWRPVFAEFVRRFKAIAFPISMLGRVQVCVYIMYVCLYGWMDGWMDGCV